jgi:DASH complex subunit Spc34.
MTMSSLSDYTDRLGRIAKSIGATASTARNTSGPFTSAVLHTPLEDLIRDVDTSELGLFTLQTRQGEKKEEEIGRVMFGGATPLKKGRVAEGKRKEVEIEPEVYAQAALKYLDRLYVVFEPFLVGCLV